MRYTKRLFTQTLMHAKTVLSGSPASAYSAPSSPLPVCVGHTIPHPDDIHQPIRFGKKYHVVYAGTRVGIFGDWCVIFSFPFTISATCSTGGRRPLFTPMAFPILNIVPSNCFPRLSHPIVTPMQVALVLRLSNCSIDATVPMLVECTLPSSI